VDLDTQRGMWSVASDDVRTGVDTRVRDHAHERRRLQQVRLGLRSEQAVTTLLVTVEADNHPVRLPARLFDLSEQSITIASASLGRETVASAAHEAPTQEAVLIGPIDLTHRPSVEPGPASCTLGIKTDVRTDPTQCRKRRLVNLVRRFESEATDSGLAG